MTQKMGPQFYKAAALIEKHGLGTLVSTSLNHRRNDWIPGSTYYVYLTYRDDLTDVRTEERRYGFGSTVTVKLGRDAIGSVADTRIERAIKAEAKARAKVRAQVNKVNAESAAWYGTGEMV